MNNPFFLFSWQKPFLPALKNFMDKAGRPGDTILIVPHKRPGRYMRELYKGGWRPVLLPQVLTVGEVVQIWAGEPGNSRLVSGTGNESGRIIDKKSAGILDRVAMLHQAVRTLEGETGGLASLANFDDIADFLPWGLSLDKLIGEILAEGRQPSDLANLEYDLSGPASSLLGSLGKIGARWQDLLNEKGWTSNGLDCLAAAEQAEQIPAGLLPGPDRLVCIAGFARLSGCEEKIFRTLWKAGAKICLHGDPALAGGGQPHFACEPLRAWQARWKAGWILADADPSASLALAKAGRAGRKKTDPARSGPEFFFFSGYDVHSQILALQNDLAGSKAGDRERPTAIIATHPGLLQPVLQHLAPGEAVNVSMGYPLANAPLCQLVESLLVLQENRNQRGEYLKKDVLAVLASPCLRSLAVADPAGTDPPAPVANDIEGTGDKTGTEQPGDGGDRSGPADENECLRTSLDALAALVRPLGTRLAGDDIFQAFERAAMKSGEPVWQPQGQAREILDTCLDLAINVLAEVESSGEMATWLSSLTSFFVSHGAGLLASQPLDAELVYHLRIHVIPELAETMLAAEPLPKTAIYGLLRQLIAGQRVPFEATGTGGIQVLGLLETRLLDFGRICILDATDDILPGGAGNDPLLPDSLRPAIGLPDARSREAAAAYNLYRLIQSAEKVHFYWQEGITRSTIFDGRKVRSRFVEQIIWEEEKRRASCSNTKAPDPDVFLLKPGDASFNAAVSLVSPIVTDPAVIRRTEATDKAMRKFLAGKISAKDVDTWLKCPLQFYFARLCKLASPDDGEQNDHLLVGNCVHAVLKELYRPYKGQEISLHDEDQTNPDDISQDELNGVFAQVLRSGPGTGARHWGLGVDSYIMLGLAGPRRLANFLRNQPARTRVLELEYYLEKPVTIMGNEYRLNGVIDRLDEREAGGENGQENGLVILDYKTGDVKRLLPKQDFWSDDFGQKLADTCKQVQDGGLANVPGDPLSLSSQVAELAERVPSLQLFVYLLLVEAEMGKIQADACYVDLKESGREYSVFGSGLSGEEEAAAIVQDSTLVAETCRNLIGAVLQDMQTCQAFAGREGDHCDYCEYAGICRQWDHGLPADSGCQI